MKIVRVLLLIFLAGWLIWFVNEARTVYPTPDTESSFLKTYTPTAVIDRFKAVPGTTVSVGASAGADLGFATHQADFKPTLVINTGDRVAVMQALRDDIALRLTEQHAAIVEDSGSPADGFTIKYAVGKSQGTVVVEPLKSVDASSLGRLASAPGTATVSFHIYIKEQWFKSEDRAEKNRTSS